MTLKKWNKLFEHFKNYHNMKIMKKTFILDQDEETSDEWLK